MLSLPPFLIVLDLSALIAGNLRDWQTISPVGKCLVPKAVLEEMENLSQTAPEATTEHAAREFVRFFPTSEWQITQSLASHPSLKEAEGHTLSKKARLSLTVAQTVYGLARNHPDALVLLVANDATLVQRLKDLDVTNLCGIPYTALVQWARTQRRPILVTQQLQVMRPESGVVGGATHSPAIANRPAAQSSPSPVADARSASSRRPPWRLRFGNLFFNLLNLAIGVVVVAALWRTISPASFNQFWRQLPLPKSGMINLPGFSLRIATAQENRPSGESLQPQEATD